MLIRRLSRGFWGGGFNIAMHYRRTKRRGADRRELPVNRSATLELHANKPSLENSRLRADS